MKNLFFFILFIVFINNQLLSQSHLDQNGIKTSVTNILSANGTQARRFEIALVGYNSHHWQYSGVILIELFENYYGVGYEKYIVEVGYQEGTGTTNPKLEKIDSKGLYHYAKITFGEAYDLGSYYSGHINKALPIYLDIRHYGKYQAKITYLRNKVEDVTSLNQIKINLNPTGVNISDFSVSPITQSDITSSGNLRISGSGNHYITNGKIGIGTTSPGSGISPDPDLKVQVNGGITLQSGKKLALDQNYYVHGYLQYDNSVSDGRLKYHGYYGHRWMTSSGEKMRLTRSGQLGIGTTNPGIYKLAVEGVIGAREVVVTTDGWSDFVFEPTYNLIPLENLEQFIKQNKHLPDVPSADEVIENGLSLGQSDAILLQKVEELTLYLIEQNKEMKEVKERMNKIEAENKKIKESNIQLEKKIKINNKY